MVCARGKAAARPARVETVARVSFMVIQDRAQPENWLMGSELRNKNMTMTALNSSLYVFNSLCHSSGAPSYRIIDKVI